MSITGLPSASELASLETTRVPDEPTRMLCNSVFVLSVVPGTSGWWKCMSCSTWNADGRWQGWADPSLSEAGRDQADAAATLLADAGETFPGGVVSSDLARARETADIVAVAMSLGEVRLDPALRERDVGAWSG